MSSQTSTCRVMMVEGSSCVQDQRHHDEGVTLSSMGQISRLWSYSGPKTFASGSSWSLITSWKPTQCFRPGTRTSWSANSATSRPQLQCQQPIVDGITCKQTLDRAEARSCDMPLCGEKVLSCSECARSLRSFLWLDEPAMFLTLTIVSARTGRSGLYARSLLKRDIYWMEVSWQSQGFLVSAA